MKSIYLQYMDYVWKKNINGRWEQRFLSEPEPTNHHNLNGLKSVGFGNLTGISGWVDSSVEASSATLTCDVSTMQGVVPSGTQVHEISYMAVDGTYWFKIHGSDRDYLLIRSVS